MVQHPSLDRTRSGDLLQNRLRSALRGRRNGFRLPTEKELAGDYHVSLPTVRKALVSLSEEGLILPTEGKGWKVTAKARSERIALLYELDLAQTPVAHSHLLRIQESKRLLEALGYEVSLYLGDARHTSSAPVELTCRQFIKDHEAGLFSGVLGLWGHLGEKWTASLKAAGVPVVGFAPFYENMVSYDTLAYIRRALELFKQRGRQRVAYLGTPAGWNIGGRDQERLARIKQLMVASGLKTDDEWLRQEWHHSTVAGRWSSFRELWTARRERPDALILHSVGAWHEVENALSSFNLTLPHDLDIAIASETPLSLLPGMEGTLQFHFDSRIMIRQAVELLHDLLQGNPVASSRRYVDAWHYAGDPETTPLQAAPSSEEKHHWLPEFSLQ